jgi:hypothetical protein
MSVQLLQLIKAYRNRKPPRNAALVIFSSSARTYLVQEIDNLLGEDREVRAGQTFQSILEQ